MTIEEILKTVEEMDRDEYVELIFGKKFGDIMFSASGEASEKLWQFERKYDDVIYGPYMEAYFDGYFTEHYEELGDMRKTHIRKYILVMAYFETVSKITDKFEELIGNIE